MNRIVNYVKLILAIIVPMALFSCEKEIIDFNETGENIAVVNVFTDRSTATSSSEVNQEKRIDRLRLSVFDKKDGDIIQHGTTNAPYTIDGNMKISIKTNINGLKKKIYSFANYTAYTEGGAIVEDQYFENLSTVDRVFGANYALSSLFHANDGKGSFDGGAIPDNMFRYGMPMTAVLDDFDVKAPADLKLTRVLAKVNVRIVNNTVQTMAVNNTSVLSYNTSMGGQLINASQGNTRPIPPSLAAIVTHTVPYRGQTTLKTKQEGRIFTMYLPPRSIANGNNALKIKLEKIKFWTEGQNLQEHTFDEIILNNFSGSRELKAGHEYTVTITLNGKTNGNGNDPTGIWTHVTGISNFVNHPVILYPFPPLPPVGSRGEVANCFRLETWPGRSSNFNFNAHIIGRVHTAGQNETQIKATLAEYDPGLYAETNHKYVKYEDGGDGYTYVVIRPSTMKITWQTYQGRAAPYVQEKFPNIITKGRTHEVIEKHSVTYNAETGVCGFNISSSHEGDRGGMDFGFGNASYNRVEGGNAVISAHTDKDEVLWSWHIWVIDSDLVNGTLGVRDRYIADYNVKLFSRSIATQDLALGSIGPLSTAFPRKKNGAPSGSDGDVDLNGLGARFSMYGMLYQWGRKDPFPSAPPREVPGMIGLGLSSVVPDITDGVVGTGNHNPNFFPVVNTNSIDAIKINSSPKNIFSRIETTPANNRNNKWWSTTRKTMYDPCPATYRVPVEKGVYARIINAGLFDGDGLSKDNFAIYFDGLPEMAGILEKNEKMAENVWEHSEFTFWRGVPASGFRSGYGTGDARESGRNGYYWTAETGDGNRPFYVKFGVNVVYTFSPDRSGGEYKVIAPSSAADAFAIQCVKNTGK